MPQSSGIYTAPHTKCRIGAFVTELYTCHSVIYVCARVRAAAWHRHRGALGQACPGQPADLSCCHLSCHVQPRVRKQPEASMQARICEGTGRRVDLLHMALGQQL